MKRTVSVLVLVSLLLSGCAQGLSGIRPLTYATPAEAHVYATGEKCPHEAGDREFAGLIAAALTGIASTLLKNFGAALSEGAKGGALPSSTSTQNLQLDPGKTPKCIIIIRGAFQATSKNLAPIVDLATYLGIGPDAADQRLRLNGLNIPPIYRVDHYIELRMDSSNNGKALTFAPLYVRLGQSIDGATRGERDLSIAVKFNRVGADPVGSAIVIADRKIGSEAPPSEAQPNGRYSIEAPWFGTFHAPAAVAGTATAAAPAQPRASRRAPGPVGRSGSGAGGGGIAAPPTTTPGGAVAVMQSDSKDAVPVTVTATVVETRPTNEGLAFIATVFNGLEPKIEAAVNPLIDSRARRTADAADDTATLGAQADYATAIGAADAAVISYCEAASADTNAAGRQDRITKSTAARAAQLKANVAAIKAELDQPFTALVVISALAPDVVNIGPCSAH